MRTLFLLSRLGDVLSTVANLYIFGYNPDLELNPINRFLLENGIGYFILYQILVTLALLNLDKYRLGRYILTIIILVSILITVWNVLILLSVTIFL